MAQALLSSWRRRIKSVDYDELLSYQTVKYVKIKEKKLGILHYSLELGIFLYIVIYTIVYQQRYLLSEAPYGSVRATMREPSAWIPANTLPYCLQNQTTVNNFTNYNCTYMRGTDVTFPPGLIDSIFISTRVKDTFYSVSPNCTNDLFDFQCAPSTTPSSTLRYYIAGIEKFTLYMEHAVFGRQNQILVSNFQCDGTLIFRNGTKQTMSFNDPSRTGDIIDVTTLINSAGVNSLNDASGVGSSYRYDGLLIVSVISYQNYVTKPTSYYYTYENYAMPLQDVLTMQPSVNVPGGTMQRNWYGVRVLFMVVGSIGLFDFLTLLTSLVSGFVLIKLASVVVDILLLYALPAKRVYSRHKYELAEEEKKEDSPLADDFAANHHKGKI